MTNESLAPSIKFTLYQWHKSLGVIVLILVFVRVLVKIFVTAPPLPSHFAKLEKYAAYVGHFALYVLMIAMPLSGWIMVSSSVYGLPTIVFDLFEWPHIPGIAGNAELEKMASSAHSIIFWMLVFLLLAHIGAVVKHAIWDHENLLRRMWFSVRKGEETR